MLTDIPGRTLLIEHPVLLRSDKPIYKKQYIVPYALRQKVQEEVQNMLNAGFIEKSKSAYAAPIVVV